MGHIGLVEWIADAQAGSQQAIARVYSYLRLELEPLLRAVPTGIDAEDVFEETALVVFKNISRVKEREKISRYASQVFRHLVLKLSRERRRCLSSLKDNEISSPDVASTNLEREELLQRLVGGITEVERELFALVYVEGLSNTELAQKLKISNGSGRHRKHALNRKLRAVLSRLAIAELQGAAGGMIP